MQRLKVPPVYSPFPTAIHPQAAAINAQTTTWANRFQIGSDSLRKRLVRQDIGTFAARVMPDGNREAVQILADFILWLFGVDDGHCEEGDLGRHPGQLAGTLSQLLRTAQDPNTPILLDDPLAEGLRDLRRRLDRLATPTQAARWVDALREYFLSVVWEASHRSRLTVPDLNDYTLMRLYNGATTVVYPLLEIGHGYQLHPNIRDNTAVRYATEMASFIITWDNDIFSYHKEHRSQTFYLNAIRVLEHEYGHTPDQALSQAIAQRDRVTCLFLRHSETLRRQARQYLRQYLGGLETFVRGAQDWGISSLRYTTPNDPAPLPQVFSSSPTDNSTEPLPIPAISCWWQATAPTSPTEGLAAPPPRSSPLARTEKQDRIVPPQ
ncbi:selina-4(15),7(11)-diene synthase [Streptomyces antimycoticus]|uniref:selina-4(15),7(11)-diene synthase n=1 Tax=Streptomyces antimycoticus TaxID=68175 RepID=UPI00344136A7